MTNKYPYLQNQDFLKEIDELPVKEQFVKIILLDWNTEEPIQEIQGKITSGLINIDGSSAIRRTCNLSMFIDSNEANYNDISQVISLNKKVEILVGFTNATNLYKNFPIIWFPLGYYVMINVSLSHTTSGTTVSLQLKDKMCLLNGEISGVLPATVVFHEREDVNEKGEVEINKPTIYQIILELVNHFGNEQLGKILISDLDTKVKQVMKWTGSTPVYMQEIRDQGQISYIFDTTGRVGYQQFTTGMDIGFVYTDFVYPGELIGNAGQSVVDILENIKSTLGNFEFFYDINGNFRFQEIKNYLNTTQTKYTLDQIKQGHFLLGELENSNYLMDIGKGKSVYTFNNNNLITSYSNAPQYNMIKNDFIVWGKRKTVEGAELPIRFHLAIDKKPETGHSYSVLTYHDEDLDIDKTIISQEEGSKTITTNDWRTELYLNGANAEKYAVNSNYYYTELINEWPKLFDIEKGEFQTVAKQRPYELDYFLDFIDSSSAIGQFSISNIGRRSKVVVDDKVNCVFEPDIPDVILLEVGSENLKEQRDDCKARGQIYTQVPSYIFAQLEMGGSFNSAYNAVQDLLYQHTNYNETISLQALPIYHLEPNTRISVQDIDSNIYGDYMIKSISLPLDVNGIMSISATKVLTKI